MRVFLLVVSIWLFCSQLYAAKHYELTENFYSPQFYSGEIHFWEATNLTKFAVSQNSGFEWGAYSPVVTTNWAPIGYLYSSTASSSRNALCFTNDSELSGTYAYCQFYSVSVPLKRDSLIGLSKVAIDYTNENAQDKLGLVIRDAKGQWYYSAPKHQLAAQGTTTFDVIGFTWMKIASSTSENLDTHANINNGLGDITVGAVEGSPDLSYVTGGGIILHEAVIQNLNLRIKSIQWTGKQSMQLASLVAPADIGISATLSPKLKWSFSGTDPVKYNVYFSKMNETLIRVATSINQTEYQVADLDDQAEYQWRIDVINETETIQGKVWRFTVKHGMTPFFIDLQSTPLHSGDVVTWKPVGPGMAGYCEEFWCHPTDVNSMYMSPDMSNSYGTWDGGKSWQTIKDCDGTGIFMRRVQSITFSHQNPDFGMAIDVRGYLYRTADRGHNWVKESFSGEGRYSELAVDPTNDKNWYMGAGDFWDVKFNHRNNAALNDPSTGYFYAYSAYGHIYKSTDGGKTWSKKTSGLPAKLDVGKIIVDPTNPMVIIAATNYGIYRSTDQGETWTKQGSGLPNNMPRDMDAYYDSATNEFFLYVVDQTSFEPTGNTVSAKGGVYISTDHGLNWSSITGNLAINLQSVTSSAARSEYYESLAYWLGITSTEAKSTYSVLPTNIFSVFNRIRVNPKNKNEIYLTHNVKHDYAFGPGDVWKTIDGGITWKVVVRSGIYWQQNSDAAYWANRDNPTSVNTKFGHIQPEINRGEEWAGNRFLEINSEGNVFICIDQQVFKSSDGAQWNQIDDYETSPGSNHWVGSGDSNLPGRYILMETGVKNRYLFCSGEHGLWQSASLENYPDTMAVAVEQLEGQINENGATSIATVAVHPKDPNTIYILMFRQDHQGYFRKSADGGKTWQDVSKPVNWSGNLSNDMMFQYSLMVDYQSPENIYFCMPENAPTEVSSNLVPDGFLDFGVYKSTDSGVNWSLSNNGFPANSSVHRLTMDPVNHSILYAALNISRKNVAGGLYKSTDKGVNWVKMSIPDGIKSVNNIFIDRNTKYMFISCGTDVGTFAEGGVWRSKDGGANWEKIFFMPYIMQTETSPVNSNIITVNAMGPVEKSAATYINPGAYLSKDGGETWEKINNGLGQPNSITDLKPDAYTEGIYWLSQFGSGWSIGYDKAHKNAWWHDSETTTSVSGMVAQKNLFIYPNPASKVLHISNLKSDDQIFICNLNGQIVIEQQNVNDIDISGLKTGIYLIRVKGSQGVYLSKFIKSE